MLYKYPYRYYQLLAQIVICLLTLNLTQCQGCNKPVDNQKSTQQLPKPSNPLPASQLDEKIVAGITNEFLKKSMMDLLAGKPVDITQRDPNHVDRDTLIILAVKEPQNKVEILQGLLSHGKDKDIKQKVNLSNTQGQTALELAVNNYDPEVIKLLIDHGANPYEWNNRGLSPVYMAIANNNLPALKLLVDKDNCDNVCDKKERTPLGFAVSKENKDKDNKEIVKYLLSLDADPLKKNSKQKSAPLDLAIRSGRLDIVKLLFENERRKISYNVVIDWTGSTPLHIAAFANNKDIVEYLLSNGANKTQKDALGNYPVVYASDSTIKNLLKIDP